MPVKNDREYRSFQTFETEKSDPYTVTGYASTFEPYVMLSVDGTDYSERIDPRAFDAADMSDVIMQYDHSGHVFARQSNNTLQVSTDEHGLKIRADLSKTNASKELYEEIRTGLITKMSFAFVADGDHYEKDTHTRVIDRVKKVYDVSAVSIPANPGTDISARDYFNGVIEIEKAERLEAQLKEQKKKKLGLKLKLMEDEKK